MRLKISLLLLGVLLAVAAPSLYDFFVRGSKVTCSYRPIGDGNIYARFPRSYLAYEGENYFIIGSTDQAGIPKILQKWDNYSPPSGGEDPDTPETMTWWLCYQQEPSDLVMSWVLEQLRRL